MTLGSERLLTANPGAQKASVYVGRWRFAFGILSQSTDVTLCIAQYGGKVSETERRLRYDNRRVLIDTERVLDPQFDDAVLHVTGGQLELLRNLMIYLHRESTFVSEYHVNYYLTPTVGEWDSLLSVVANLEETLMGNENVIWGYFERWVEWIQDIASGAGDAVASSQPVVSGYVQVLQRVAIHHDAGVSKFMECQLVTPTLYVPIFQDKTAASDEWRVFSCEAVLKSSDYIKLVCYAPGDGKKVNLRIWGYKMRVPAV